MNPRRTLISMPCVAAAFLLAGGALALICWRHGPKTIPAPEIPRRDLVLRDGRWYRNEEIPMSHGQPDGIVWAYYPSGFLKAQTKACDGQVLNRKSWKDGECKNIP
jgi:hypothetical protein